MTTSAQIFFNQPLISMNLYQHAKIFQHFALEILDLKFPQSDWLRELSPISQEPEFLQKSTFIIDQIEKKLITKFSYIFKEP